MSQESQSSAVSILPPIPTGSAVLAKRRKLPPTEPPAKRRKLPPAEPPASPVNYTPEDYEVQYLADPIVPAEVQPVPALELKVSNVVGTLDIGCLLDLRRIENQVPGANYNPERFSAVVVRFPKPDKFTGLIFGTGKVVITGSRSIPKSYVAYGRVVELLVGLGYTEARALSYRVDNIVATAEARIPVRLQELATAHSVFATYEPEVFAGIIYKPYKPRVTIMIFGNGNLLFTGAKDLEELDAALDYIYPVIRQHRREDEKPV